MNTILITATESNSGKTAVALALGLIARDRGQSVGYMKPKGTRLESDAGETRDTDPVFARELLDLDAGIDDLEPIVYSPTFIEEVMRGGVDPAVLQTTVRERFEGLSADRDLMIVEGSGTRATGGVVGLTDPELATALDARVILVADYERPEDIDGIVAVADDIGDRLAGILFNDIPESRNEQLASTVIPFLRGKGYPVLGTLPQVTELAGVTVADLAADLDADILTDVPTDAYVEHLVVGAMGAEESLRYFRRADKTVLVTGGDRADIQTVALETSGIKCLCLTGGLRPSPAVLGKAETQGTPILLVDSDTLSTIDRIEDIIRSGRVRDEATVERMRGLLETHVDIDTVLTPE